VTPQEIRNVLAEVRYKRGYELICRPLEHAKTSVDFDRYYLQVSASIPFPAPMRGSRILKGGKWVLSEHMTPSELVQKAFQAFLAFEEHEVREHFTYKGQRVLGPHNDLDRMADLMASGELTTSERK
jgi:hypothetical protein